MESLTKEEVLHVARLARVAVTDEEIEKYGVELKKLMDDINKIKEVECRTEEILVTPVSHTTVLREDANTRVVDFSEIQLNLPSSVGKFVEVQVSVDE